ncbi:nitroreductase [Clostridium sporogenes]|uniref:Nitroreductase family n=1 Tax=Clostridium sporogenes TaxID=1509 RepID=A0A7U4LMF9_CLOSG|nr:MULTISPECIES: nitroreductase [Clostridium]AJD31466.1 nitroreductase family protein [Clostridium botulinum Prevot_594]AKC62277.1 nitroreductase family [Clostridium sporogenes]AKJ89556.1 nitroreductase [Clostridium sporogenes]EHN16329.1 putative nitroreductase [Clostridium sporogenes PA 3679]KCZ69586.1 nitroreductase family [Clostridium sporogenes]
MNTILNRKSIRKYKDIKVNDDIAEDLLKAGMAVPPARVSR